VKYHEAANADRHLDSITYEGTTLARKMLLLERRKEDKTMQRLTLINPAEATGKAKKLLDGVQEKLGITPNMMKTLANSPAVLEAYLRFEASLSTGALEAQFREEVALAVAQANSCEYCLSAHSAIGSMVGLTAEEIVSSREAHAANAKRDAGLRFAQTVVVQRGEVSDGAIDKVRQAGYTDGEIAEIVATVAINIFTNYFNHVARTEVDFPLVSAVLGN
jgi:uncharacterized peroxidase-related enzyme